MNADLMEALRASIPARDKMGTDVPCDHPTDAISVLKGGGVLCVTCAGRADPPAEPQKTVCVDAVNPNEVRPAVKLANIATDLGWTTALTAQGNVVVLTVERNGERGAVSWTRNDEGTWRFTAADIAGVRFGVRQVPERLARVNEPDLHIVAVPALPAIPPVPADVAARALAAIINPPTTPAPAGGVMPTGTLASFMAAPTKALAINGNTPWANAYAATLREIIERHGRNSERNRQVHLGPSELGVPCDRQVAGKFAGLPEINNVVDPWPSILGTAGHAWLAEAFKAENDRNGLRWVPENRVEPHPDHSGTADLYDGAEQAVVDWKILSADKIEKLASKGLPSVQYQLQLLLYGLGYRRLGLPVKRVALVALPRTKATLDNMYVWDHELTPADDARIDELWSRTAVRRAWGDEILAGRVTLLDVPSAPDSETCYFCPFYRPSAAEDNGGGCAGTKQH